MSNFYSDLKTSLEKFHKVSLDSEIVIYGAGNTGKKVLNVLRSMGIEPNCFLDEYAQQTSIDGLPVRKLANVATSRSCMVVIAIFNREPNANIEDIKKVLTSNGFNNACSFEKFYLSYSDHFSEEFFWLAPTEKLLGKFDLAQSVEKQLGDAKSIELFRATLKYRLTGEYREFPPIEWDNQYFPKDIPLLPQPWRFVDLGAFDGDTLMAFKKNNISLESVFAFEPDLKNFSALIQNSKEFGPFAKKLACFYPCGAGKTCEIISFASEGLESSRAFSKGQGNAANITSITSIAVGDVLKGAHPNYIKMDIEGAEAEAIMGLEDEILQERPMLAVSAYHKPLDIFELPLMLQKICPLYDFYFRLHGEHGFETVLYAIPQNSSHNKLR